MVIRKFGCNFMPEYTTILTIVYTYMSAKLCPNHFYLCFFTSFFGLAGPSNWDKTKKNDIEQLYEEIFLSLTIDGCYAKISFQGAKGGEAVLSNICMGTFTVII